MHKMARALLYLQLACVVLSLNFGCSAPSGDGAETEAGAPAIAGPVFDVPALIGKNVDEVRAVLGNPDKDDDSGELGHLIFRKDGQALGVDYDKSTKAVREFFVSTDQKPESLANKEDFLKIGNLKANDAAYAVEFVEAVAQPGTYTGVKVLPVAATTTAAPVMRNVTYRVTGDPTTIYIGWTDADGKYETEYLTISSRNQPALLPWQRSFTAPVGKNLSLSVDMRIGGSVTAEVLVDGQVKAEESATGLDRKVSCSVKVE